MEDRVMELDQSSATVEEAAAALHTEGRRIAKSMSFLIGDHPILGDPKTGSIMDGKSPFMSGIILTITVILFIPGAVYGFASGKYKNDKDMFADISQAFKDISSYILLCFFCAQFTSYFAWSNLGAVLAIKGAGLLTCTSFAACNSYLHRLCLCEMGDPRACHGPDDDDPRL